MVRFKALSYLSIVLFFVGCSSYVDPYGTTEGDEEQRVGGYQRPQDPEMVSHSPLHRLSGEEYNNTIRDLLGDDTNPANGFESEVAVANFNKVGSSNSSVSASLWTSYMEAAEAIASRAVTQRLSTTLNCDRARMGDDACAAQFIKTFGKRAFRRPLSDAEIAGLTSLYTAKKTDGFAPAVQMVLHAMLVSPHFLYRAETTDTQPGDVKALNDWELASRLSYFIWSSMPDDELFRAAENGELRNTSGIKTQVTRMLAHEKAKKGLSHFYTQWLGIDRIDRTSKDSNRYPSFTPRMVSLMKTEVEKLMADLISNGADARKFLTASYTYLNAELASYYGISGVSGDDFTKTDVATQRSGVLTTGAWMAGFARPSVTLPIMRGKALLVRLLCGTLPPPPQGQNIVTPPLIETGTTRQFFERVTEGNAACKTCHDIGDGIGFGLEHFGPDGKWRDKENGLDINVASSVTLGGVPTRYEGAKELFSKIAESEEYKSCIAKNVLRFGLTRAETEQDAATLERLNSVLRETNYSLIELFSALSVTDAMRFRRQG